MIDKVTEFFIGHAHAASSAKPNFFNVFTGLFPTPSGTDAQSTFGTVIGRVMTWVLAIVAIIAFIYLIISGVNYITAGGDAEKATKARTGIINAIIGIVVVVLSYFILTFAVNLGGNLGNGF